MGGFDAQEVTRGIEGDDPRATLVVGHDIEGEPVLEDCRRAVTDGRHESPFNLCSSGSATSVQDAGYRVTALSRPRQPPPRHSVENRTQSDELVNPLGALVNEHPDCSRVAESGPSAKGVGEVEIGRVLVTGENRRDATLGPACGRLVELTLGDDADAAGTELG